MPTDHPDDEPEVWPPHTGEGPDVSNLGNEAETELSQAEIDCDPNTDTDDLNHRYDPVD